MAKILFDDRNNEEQYFYCDFKVLPIGGQILKIRSYNKRYELEVTDVVHHLENDHHSSRTLSIPDDYSDRKSKTASISVHCYLMHEEDIEPRRPMGDF